MCTRCSRSPGEPRPQMTKKLVVRAPGGQSHEFPVTAPVITMGRGRACDIVLEYAYVSRLHARVELTNAGCAIADCESTNGTYVNGRRIDGMQPLAPGDHIGIGEISIAFLDASADDTTTTRFRVMPAGCPIRCDSSAWQVWVGGRQLDVRLSLQEFELLSFLASRFGAVCTRDELGASIWGEGNYDYNMLHQLVNRLKRKLGHQQGRLVTSVPGRGYSIAAP